MHNCSKQHPGCQSTTAGITSFSNVEPTTLMTGAIAAASSDVGTGCDHRKFYRNTDK